MSVGSLVVGSLMFSECRAFLLSQLATVRSGLEMDWMSCISGIHMPNDSAEWKLIYFLVDVKSDCCDIIDMVVTMNTEADVIYPQNAAVVHTRHCYRTQITVAL